MKNLTRLLALGAVFSASLASSVPAFAGGASTEVASETVKYADLNLTNPEGAKALYTRLQKAARRVCYATTGGDASLPGLISRRSCENAALDSAVKDVNKPLLTALHQGTPGALTASR